MIEYTLKMNSDQARACLNAVELLMRLKLNQAFTFNDSICGWNVDDWNDWHEATRHVETALGLLFKCREPETWKDPEWYRLYNLYQVIRYQVHMAENPTGTGVDSYPPIQFTDEPLPECAHVKKEC